jgi:hypothetical protein
MVDHRDPRRTPNIEALRILLLRDGDGGEEGFLRRRSVHAIVLQQNFAADAMTFRSEPAYARSFGFGDRSIHRGTGPLFLQTSICVRSPAWVTVYLVGHGGPHAELSTIANAWRGRC